MPPRKVIRAIPVTFHSNIAQWLVVDCPKRDLVSLSCASRAWQVQAEQILWTGCSLDMPASPNTPNLDTIIRRFKKHIGNLTIWVKESNDGRGNGRLTKKEVLFLTNVGSQITSLTLQIRTKRPIPVPREILDNFTYENLEVFNLPPSLPLAVSQTSRN